MIHKAGTIEFDTETAVLSGPNGFLRLAAHHLRLLERLIQRPGVIVSHSDLIMAMYPDDDEPDSADVILRKRVSQLTSVLLLFSGQMVQIRNSVDLGYYVWVAGKAMATEQVEERAVL